MKNRNIKTSFDIKKGVAQFSPKHPFVKHCLFIVDNNNDDESSKAKSWDNAELEAHFVDAMAMLGESNGMDRDDVVQLISSMLRMLKSQSVWSK